MRQILAGTVDVSVVIRIIDSVDGTPETGVVFNTAGIDLQYRRELATSVAITEATLATLATAHSDGGFLHIGNGYYRLDLPDLACAVGAVGVLVHGTVTGMVVIGEYIELVRYNPYDDVRMGLTALPNSAAEAAGGLYTRGTGAGQINQPANGMIDGNVVRWLNAVVNALITGRVDTSVGAMATDVITATAIATDAIGSAELAATAITEIQTGLATSAALTTAQTDLDDIQARLPAALVGGRIDASVGAMAANTLTATAIATDAITAAKIADNAIDAATFAADTALRFRGSVVSDGADSGTTTTMVDALRTEADVDYWKGSFILFTSGTLNGQCRLITAFDPATDTITFTPPTSQAVSTHSYEILPAALPDTGLQSIRSGKAQAGSTSTTIVLDTGASATDDFYNFTYVFLTGGTGTGQLRRIRDYTGSTKTAAIARAWITTPDNTSTFAILPEASVWDEFVADHTTTATYGAVTGQSLSTSELIDNLVGPLATVVANGANTATTFQIDIPTVTEGAANWWNDAWLSFDLTSALAGQVKKISAFNQTTGMVTVASAFTAIPTATNTARVVTR